MGFDYVGTNIAKLNYIIGQLVTTKSVLTPMTNACHRQKFCLGEGEETVTDGLLPLEPHKRGGSDDSLNCTNPTPPPSPS